METRPKDPTPKMSTDRALTSVLRALQNVHDLQQTNKILSTTTYLLTTLSNPLNITLLTSQLLVSPTVWSRGHDSHMWLRIIGIFNTAAITVQKHRLDEPKNLQPGLVNSISCEEWARAVVKGTDEKSPRWRHLLVIAGVLLGMEGQYRQGLSKGLRLNLEEAIVTATNLALVDQVRDGGLTFPAIVLALSHTFDILSEGVKKGLNYEELAPITIHSIIGSEAYQEGYILGALDLDVEEVAGHLFDWPAGSPSFLQLQKIASRPLVSAMGPLSRLTAHSICSMPNARQVKVLLDAIAIFTSNMTTQWRHNKLSVIDPSEEDEFLTADTTNLTFPLLWRVLKTIMFAIVNILRAIISRCLVDRVLIMENIGPVIASQVLHVLRNIYFVSSRLGSNTFSAYKFSFLASIDILSHFPEQARTFLTQIRPSQIGRIPAHPLDRNLDLFFMNTCEHFTLILSPQDNESLIATPVLPYLNPGAHRGLIEIFEAAHSAILAVFAAPQNAPITAKIIPFYVEALFQSFPTNLSPRQFRFAFKTLLQITTPPAPLSLTEPLLPDTLLELLHHRTIHAPNAPLPPALPLKSDADTALADKQPPLSEQAVLLLTLLDALPFLPHRSLEEWLPLSAELLNSVEDTGMREVCRARFWQVLESGEMDVDRAALCVAWWSSKGGREMVLFGRMIEDSLDTDGGGPYMSGGLGVERGGSRL